MSDEVPRESEPKAGRGRIWGKRIGWVLAILLAPILLAGAFFASPIGKRFIADQIAAVAPASGLRFEVGRIEGDVFSRAVLYDVVAKDPQGTFLTAPQVTLDWRPLVWLWSGLHVEELVVERARLERLPELLPGDPDAPLLPDFDIRVGRLAIEDMRVAPGIAGELEQRADLEAEIDIRSGRALVDAQGRFGREDRLAFLLDAMPDGDRFDLALDYSAAADGPIAAMAGLEAAYRAQIKGDGSWSRWTGHALVERTPHAAAEGEAAQSTRVAAFRLTNRAGRYGLLGEVSPVIAAEGILARALGDGAAVSLAGTLEDSVFDGSLALVTEALFVRGGGVLDLADNAADGFEARLTLRDPELFGDSVRLENAELAARLTGRFDALSINHTFTASALDTGAARIEQLAQSGTATYIDGAFALPLDVTAARVTTGQDLVDPRLVGGTLRGRLTYRDARLDADRVRLDFPGLNAVASLRGNLDTGAFAIAGPVNAQGVTVPDVGEVSGTAKVLAQFGTQIPWSLNANAAGRLAQVSNASIANIAGDPLRFRGSVSLGADRPIIMRDVVLESDRLTARFDSRVQGGRTTLAGSGRQAEYGPFEVSAQLAGDALSAELVLADPYPAAGLVDVRIGIEPSEDGFALDVAGGSLLGPFEGTLGLVLPEGGPTRLDIAALRVYRTTARGTLTFGDAGLAGDLSLAGGGLDGTVSLFAGESGATRFDADLVANGARFGGETTIALAAAQINASGRFGGGTSTEIEASISGQGFQYGQLTIARFAANADIEDGRGRATAAIAGRRADRFSLKLNGDITPERIALLAGGEYGGGAITMPRRAVLTALDGGGYALAPTQIGFARGYAILEGQLGGAATVLSARLARMPLRLADLAGAGLGLSGRLSGTLAYEQRGDGAPTGEARLMVDDFARSGLVLSSRPIDLVIAGDLGPSAARFAARLDGESGQLGRVDGRITGIDRVPGDLAAGLRQGRLEASLSYEGAAESLWRLAAIETFDLTGPISVAARATGTLADPLITGNVASDNLGLQSAVSGTDISGVSARGRFAGSRLELTRFAGETRGGGTISGSGTVDLAPLSDGLGPRLDLRAAARNARLLNAAGLDATLTGPLRIVSSGRGGTIAGRVTIERASWRLGYADEDLSLPQIATREINLPANGTGRAVTEPAGSWRYLVDARAVSQIAVDGLGLDSEWGANIQLRGTVDDPRIGGEAFLVRGSYTFAGTRFDLTRGRIRFDAGAPIDPRLDIAAETATGDTNVTIAITGNSQTPEIAFASEPALPEEEILAQLLFGGSVTSLSATDAVQLGAALAALRGGGGGLDPIGELRRSIGLDQLRIVSADPAIGRGTGVALGKNLGKRVYVEIITDGRGYSATQVEYRVTRWLALLGTVTTIGRDNVSARISRDY